MNTQFGKALRCPWCHSSRLTAYDYNHHAKCNECLKWFSIVNERRDLYLQLWRDAQEKEPYKKEIWERLRRLILDREPVIGLKKK